MNTCPLLANLDAQVELSFHIILHFRRWIKWSIDFAYSRMIFPNVYLISSSLSHTHSLILSSLSLAHILTLRCSIWHSVLHSYVKLNVQTVDTSISQICGCRQDMREIRSFTSNNFNISLVAFIRISFHKIVYFLFRYRYHFRVYSYKAKSFRLLS